ncbi:hypothetical protein CCR82_14285 [Halochromatium salexigens]|uniref:Uncharacterized protein n=1 Tax=Halochromatium salexigens TaxID=49447 RepID=A0AAJ0UJ14_HALSE|nr:hypothetical protein [Halochromatium salexigens]
MTMLWKPLIGIGVAVYAVTCWSGNRELMAENAAQLVRLSDAIAETMVPRHAEGHYEFSARVVGQGPRRRVSIDAMRWAEPSPAQASAHPQPVVFAPSTFTTGRRYQSLIRIRSIPAPIIGLAPGDRSWASTSPLRGAAKANKVYEQEIGLPTLTPGGGEALKSW